MIINVLQRDWQLQSYETSAFAYVASLPDPPQGEGKCMSVSLKNNLH